MEDVDEDDDEEEEDDSDDFMPREFKEYSKNIIKNHPVGDEIKVKFIDQYFMQSFQELDLDKETTQGFEE